MNTIVARHEQLHRSELVHSLTAGNPLLQQHISALQGIIRSTNAAGPVIANSGAYKILERTLTSQARLWAYVDDFRYMALVCFACVPVVFLFKRAKARAGVVHAE